MNRRDFLAMSAASAALPRSALAAQPPLVLTAATVRQQILPEQYAGETALLGFNNGVPGPTLRLQQGKPLDVRLENRLDTGAAIHWHGIRLPNAMDGVPMLTQPLVPPGETFDYRFTPPDPGTYWYHSHYNSHEQVARGLMGPLVVEETTPPDVDHDIVAVLTDWHLTREGALTESFGNRHDVAHAGRMGNYAKVFLPDLSLRTGERIRLRLINAAVDRIFPTSLTGLDGKIVALDGMPLASPREIGMPMIAPAQRVDIIADVTGPVEFALEHHDGAYPLGGLPVTGGTTARGLPVTALPPHGIEAPATPAQHLTLRMQGGAMGDAHGGEDIWAFNGTSGMQDAPFARFREGETARISLVNDTRFPHAIHLHGHHFHELSDTGDMGDFRDTALLMAGARRDILCRFDNPGKWMMHCHMLSHQWGGMKTWFEVG